MKKQLRLCLGSGLLCSPGACCLRPRHVRQSILPPPEHPGRPASSRSSSLDPSFLEQLLQRPGLLTAGAPVRPPSSERLSASDPVTVFKGTPPPSPCPSSLLQPCSSLGSPPPRPLTPEDDSQLCLQRSHPPAHTQCSEGPAVSPEPLLSSLGPWALLLVSQPPRGLPLLLAWGFHGGDWIQHILY